MGTTIIFKNLDILLFINQLIFIRLLILEIYLLKKWFITGLALALENLDFLFIIIIIKEQICNLIWFNE